MREGEITKTRPFEVTAFDAKKKRRQRLKIKNPGAVYRDTLFSSWVFNQFAMMHLAASSLPKTIEVNFPVHSAMRDLVGKMYKFYGHSKPTFLAELGQLAPKPSQRLNKCSHLVS